MKKKKQKIIPGILLKIKLSNSKTAFARLFISKIGIYNYFENEPFILDDKKIEEITTNSILFYCCIFDYIIKDRIFETIAFKELNESELLQEPPSFVQDVYVDINDCTIFWGDGRSIQAKPEDCVGLEISSVWHEDGVIERIEDVLNGKKNFHVESNRVILTEDDPRFVKGPDVRWDFEKQIFY